MTTPFEKDMTDLEVRARGLELRIRDQATADTAMAYAKVGLEFIDKIKAFFGPRKVDSYKIWKRECDDEKAELAKLTWVMKIVTAVTDWKAEVRRKRELAEAEAKRIADKKAKDEADALRRAEAKEREAQEAEARAADAKKKLEAGQGGMAERETARIESEKAREAQAEADKILATAAEREAAAPPAVVIPDRPKTDGFTDRGDWKFEIQDEMAIPRQYLMVDQVKIGKVVRLLKVTNPIPGVRAFCERTPVRTGSRS